jgi:hypothetical protein
MSADKEQSQINAKTRKRKIANKSTVNCAFLSTDIKEE